MNPTKALVSPVRAGNLASGAIVSVAWQNECHPAGRVLSSSLPLTLTLPSGKTDDTNEGWLLVSWHQTHTHCSYCATLSLLPPGSHRHRSLRKRTCSDGQRQVRNDTGWFNKMIRVFDASEASRNLNFQQVVMQQTLAL